ncbi:DUF1990 family protein [Fluviicola taffensis]|uniref:DUF1990 domain-containing protein n=1 Tax=Fluviicola taffensis (strain DSM 16823 / NCIMB 13979 / RW262) TaxID=755732 RepID=F2IH62_FLUTR|nr:DUF1990 family protein [Fluviicola taffensis]AEA45876.1 hypothetical protein Fluta_3912 [Fluviicola taffensis DSM 16823]
MRIFLINQTDKLSKHLHSLKLGKVMSYDKALLKEKTSTVVVATTKNLEELNLDFLFDYKIFPSNILIFKAQWQEENRKMKIGDTIVQQVFIPPIKFFSQKIVFGVRIKEIFNEPTKKGFSYETLEGHVEKGISAFTAEEMEGEIIFKIATYSVPGSFLSRLVGPVFSIPYQTFCTRKALKNVKLQLENQSN